MSSEVRAGAQKDFDKREKLDRSMFLISSRYSLVALAVFAHALVFLLGLVYCRRSTLTAKEFDSNGILLVTHAAAMVLNYDATVILLPICRTLITSLRRSPLKVYLKTSNELIYHQLIAWSITFFTWVHTISYWIYYAGLAIKNGRGLKGFLYLNFATGSGWSGHIMFILVSLIAATSTQWAQNHKWRPSCTTYHVYILVFILWSIHCVLAIPMAEERTSWKGLACFWHYWLFGGLAYLIERVLREVRGRYKVHISKVIQHPSNVVELQMKQKKLVCRVGQVCIQRTAWPCIADDVVCLSLLSGSLDMGTSSVYAHQRP